MADCTYSAADGSAYCTLHGVKWGREADQADSITARSVHLVIADAARQFEREEPDRD